MKNRLAGTVYVLSSLIGVLAFLYPFILPQAQSLSGLESATGAHAADAGLLTLTLIVCCLLAVLIELQGQAVSAKTVAALGVMVALAAVLRFLETGIPGPGGFSPVFVPILLAGYVFGPRFGYLMGILTLFVSAVITGGVGPWLPYQMFVAGWLGGAAGLVPHPQRQSVELALLVAMAGFWGLLYGLLTNLYFWPFFAGAASYTWQPGSDWREALLHFFTFYLATSFIWDLFRAAGNIVLVVVLGIPTVRALSRFRDRFQFSIGGSIAGHKAGSDVPV